jgi:hypothetical protein
VVRADRKVGGRAEALAPQFHKLFTKVDWTTLPGNPIIIKEIVVPGPSFKLFRRIALAIRRVIADM